MTQPRATYAQDLSPGRSLVETHRSARFAMQPLPGASMPTGGTVSQSSPITHLASARSTTTPSASSCSNPTPCRPWCASSGRQPTVVDPSRFPRHRSRHCAVVREGHMRWPQSGRSGDSSADRNRASSGLMPPSPPGRPTPHPNIRAGRGCVHVQQPEIPSQSSEPLKRAVARAACAASTS